MIKFIDLFAGTGGIRLGFERACKELGIKNECVFSAEIDPKACMSYELNFGINPLSDVREVSELPDFNFMLAGFPCQSFSYAGKRLGFGDTRGTLFFEVERLLKQHRPKGFILENVRGLTTHDNGRTFETIKNSLKELGYSIDFFLLNSSNFGVPQNRVRIYIVGVLGSHLKMTLKSDVGASDSHAYKNKGYQFSMFEESEIQPILIKDILEDNVDEKYLCSEKFTSQLRKVVGNKFSKLDGYRLIDYRGGKAVHSWELGLKGDCSTKEIEFMNLLLANRRRKEFGTHQDGKSLTIEQIKSFNKDSEIDKTIESLLTKGYISLNEEGKYNPVCGNMSFEVFKFLDPNSISITLTASDTNRLGVVQNNIPRKLTPRECARIQGYPDSYQLIDNDLAVYKQMGNAVSVPVVQAVAKDLLSNNKLL